MSETDRIIANVNATMTMEGMPLTNEDKARIRDCMNTARNAKQHKTNASGKSRTH